MVRMLAGVSRSANKGLTRQTEWWSRREDRQRRGGGGEKQGGGVDKRGQTEGGQSSQVS